MRKMAEKELCVLTNMCMVYEGDNILVQNRLNPNWPGITFPGGHVESEESFVKSTIREVKEETGLDIWDLKLCGIKQWNSRKENYRYIVFLYKTDKFKGKLKSSSEGEVFFVNKDDIMNYPLADGFDKMLEVFFDDNITENYHYFENGDWVCENL